MSIETDGSAFPVTGTVYSQDREAFEVGCVDSGMTLRDYFAAKAMQAFICSPHATQAWIEKHLVESAWVTADKMLKARNG